MKITHISVIISILILIISSINLLYNTENKKDKETPKLAIIEYWVDSNEKYFTPIFEIKNTGYVPMMYNVTASKITKISFYDSSSTKLLEFNGDEINLGTYGYYNTGGTLLPEAVTKFYFPSKDLNMIKIPYSYYEATIVFDVEYRKIENSSNVCKLNSVYIFNSIQRIPFQIEQYISDKSCNY